MLIIAGLGNPSEEYQNTYHNIGFMAVDALAEKLGKKIKKSENNSLTAVFSYKGEKIVLAKPLTFMNLSGEAIKSLAVKHKALPSEIVVIFDDFDLPRHTARARAEGSGGSHNGMKNIIAVMNTENIKRIRIGIGRETGDAKNYVLSNINKLDMPGYEKVFDKVASALKKYIESRDFEALQREINTKEEINAR